MFLLSPNYLFVPVGNRYNIQYNIICILYIIDLVPHVARSITAVKIIQFKIR